MITSTFTPTPTLMFYLDVVIVVLRGRERRRDRERDRLLLVSLRPATVTLLHPKRRWSFPHAPPIDSSQVELIPPEVEHLPVEMKNSLSRDALGRRNQLSHAIVHATPFCFVAAKQQVPQSQRLILARFGKDGRER